MERLSNSRNEYWDQIKTELLDSIDLDKCRFRYLEIGQMLSHGYSVTQYIDNPSQLILKIWNAKFDNDRFDKGIYNLDRLSISESKVDLDPLDIETINLSLNNKLALTNHDGFVLDGLFCQLEFGSKKLNWNSNEEIKVNLSRLVELLRTKTSH